MTPEKALNYDAREGVKLRCPRRRKTMTPEKALNYTRILDAWKGVVL